MSTSSLMTASLVSTPLLVAVSNVATIKAKYIILFDVSGSVLANKKDGKLVIEIMTETLFTMLRENGITFFMCIFFGSKNPNKMKDGYIIDEGIFTVNNKESFIETAKSHADRFNLTCPHFAINNIPRSWLNTKPNESIEVMYVGDGELYDGNQSNKNSVLSEFSSSITKFLDTNPLVRLSIHTVDVVHSLNIGSENVAGMDVYDSLRSSNLTSRISNFTLYTSLTNKEELFSNKIVPAGYIGYKNQMFLSSRESEFFGYLLNEIEQCHNSTIYDIVRYASSSIANIIKSNGTTSSISESMINSYANLFINYVNDGTDDIIGEDLTRIFSKSVHNILKNQADLSTAFYTDRKKFFEEANAIMAINVKDAIGTISEKGITFPLDNKIYKINMCEVTTALNEKMPYACYKDNKGTTTPIIPLERRNGKMTNQCMRQTIRAYVSKLYGYPIQSEQAKFVPLVCMIMVYFSDVSIEVKNAYVKMGICMLEKTLTGINITEIDHLRKGNTHTVKSWVNDLTDVIQNITKTIVHPLAVWYVICKILDEHFGDDILSKNQYIHVSKIVLDSSHWKTLCNSFPKLVEEEIATSYYEFICPITHEDSSLGGYYVAPHPWNNKTDGRMCKVNSVIDKNPDIMDAFVVNDTFSCTVCRARLNRSYLHYIEKPESVTTLPVPPKDICSVIVLKGPVGSGKTTITKALIRKLSEFGSVYSANTDRHCARLVKLGGNPKNVTREAINIVSNEITVFISKPGPKFIIMDTCGERHKDGTLFSVNVPTDTWKYYTFYSNIIPSTMSPTNFNNYFAWCMLHVLNRNKDGIGDDYWLNPESAGIDVCAKVMSDKANALFPGKYKLPKFSTLEEADRFLKPMSDEYNKYLTTHYNLDTEIEKCIKTIM